jgi:CheY-like chemotaxis protein
MEAPKPFIYLTLQSLRIFCVESNMATRSTLKLVLGHAGARVEDDRWGFAETALPKMSQFAPDLVLLEWRTTPYRRVYEVYSAMRLIPTLQSVPVILLSAQPLMLTQPASLLHGISGVLKTPLNAQTVTTELLSILNNGLAPTTTQHTA